MSKKRLSRFSFLGRRLSPAMIVAVIALMFAAAGPAWALTITGKQIKNSSITTADIKNNNLTGADIKTGSLTGSDIKTGSIGGIDIVDGSIGTSDIGELSGLKLWGGSVLGDRLAAGTIQSSQLAPNARGARALIAFTGDCQIISMRAVLGCNGGGGTYTIGLDSTAVDLTSTYPVCQVGGTPGAFQCGATLSGTTVTVSVTAPTDAAHPVVVVLP